MDGMIFGLFSLSLLLIFGAIYNGLSIKKPGFFPPKKVLKTRAIFLGATGAFGLLLGIILSSFR